MVSEENASSKIFPWDSVIAFGRKFRTLPSFLLGICPAEGGKDLRAEFSISTTGAVGPQCATDQVQMRHSHAKHFLPCINCLYGSLPELQSPIFPLVLRLDFLCLDINSLHWVRVLIHDVVLSVTVISPPARLKKTKN